MAKTNNQTTAAQYQQTAGLSPSEARLQYNRQYINTPEYKLQCWLDDYYASLLRLSARDYMGSNYR